MSKEENKTVCLRADNYLNGLGYEAELASIKSSILEHEFCYSISWCEKAELFKRPEDRRTYLGGGRVLVSKINEMIDMAGSAPTTDWIHEFELMVQGLEEYWCLEIDFQKRKMNALKTLLQVNTPQLLELVNENSQIEIEGRDYELENQKKGFDTANIPAIIKLKTRKIRR